MFWMKVVVYVAPEIVVTVKPRTGANEDATTKPFRAVIAGGSTGIRRHVIVTIGTIRSCSDIDAHANLGRCLGGRSRDAEGGNSG
jgi:hypothetical protein